jgi:hypothetical protein
MKDIYFHNKKKIFLTIKKKRNNGIWDGIWDMGYGIWDMGYGIGIWDWNGIMTNGMGFWDLGWDLGWDGRWDSPNPINMGDKYI